jgi:hypothetical protein
MLLVQAQQSSCTLQNARKMKPVDLCSFRFCSGGLRGAVGAAAKQMPFCCNIFIVFCSQF